MIGLSTNHSTMPKRDLSFGDRCIVKLDQALRSVCGTPSTPGRDNPALNAESSDLTQAERVIAGRLMRVNHTGEVCAQALYQGQALTARDAAVSSKLEHAAAEENDHLSWCSERIIELDGHPSLLNPLWYTGAFAIGALAGLAGNKWNLGFLAETEHQVVAHLDDHLTRLPQDDHSSHAILKQMREDEDRHATTALRAGGVDLPRPVKKLMNIASSVMTRTAYWI